jgi:hypothetical protein
MILARAPGWTLLGGGTPSGALLACRFGVGLLEPTAASAPKRLAPFPRRWAAAGALKPPWTEPGAPLEYVHVQPSPWPKPSRRVGSEVAEQVTVEVALTKPLL